MLVVNSSSGDITSVHIASLFLLWAWIERGSGHLR